LLLISGVVKTPQLRHWWYHGRRIRIVRRREREREIERGMKKETKKVETLTLFFPRINRAGTFVAKLILAIV